MTGAEFKIKVFPLKNKLFRFAKRILDDVDEAEDMVQEAFIRLWNRRDKLDEYKSVEALSMVTIRNLCLDKVKSKRYMIEKIDDLKSEVEEKLNEDKEAVKDLVGKVHRIIATLPEQQRMIIQLRDIEGYDFEEIAGILEMNENAIRVALSRARKKIRETIANQSQYEFRRN